MIILRIPPLARGQDLRRDGPIFPPLLLHLLGHLLRNGLLLRVVVENPTPILSPHVRSLSIHCRRVVHFIQELDQLSVRQLFGVEEHQQGLGVACPTGADRAIGRIVGVASDVSDTCVDQTFTGKLLAVHVLDAPKAAGGNGAFLSIGGDLWARGVRRVESGGAGCERTEDTSKKVVRGHVGDEVRD